MAPRFPSVTHTQDITCALRDGACLNISAASEPHSRWSNHRASAAIIQSSKKNIPTISTPPLNSNHHLVDLNFSTASSTRSSSLNTATISGSDFPVFTTDSQSTWLPNSTPSLPAKSEHNHQNDNLPQDFVLFDNSPASPALNRPQSLSSHRRHSAHIPANLTTQSQQPSASAVQNQRVTQIIQAIGHHQLPSSVNSNKRFSNQFYASSAPSSTVSLNQHSRLRRPPVPLFNQSTGQVQTAKMMNAADVDLDDFIPFEGGVNTAFSSPAIPTAFDFGGSAHSSTSNLGTVSPHDLLVNEPYMSAPNSAALTSLTSPSINESPDFDAFDVSPNFGSADFDGPPIDSWYSLFPTDSGSEKPVDNSPALRSEDLEPERPASNRRKSGGSPTSGARHSSVAGVAPRKRDKPLPPIIVEDPNDTIAMKRARNTLAARKSRERKALRFDELEERIAKLEAERDHWKKIALSQSGPQ